METLAERLRYAMEVSGVSQAKLARACGVKPPSVNGWLSGKAKFLRGENLLRAAAALGVNDLWLAAGKGPMKRTHGGGQAAQFAGQEEAIIARPPITTALPVVLDAIAACPHRDELRTLLALLVDHDAPAYRARLGELLSLPPPSIAKGLIETGDFAGPAPSHDNHDPDSQHHSRKREPSR